MTEYRKYTTLNPANAPLLTLDQVKAVKEACKKLLTEIEQRRRENMRRLMQKRRLQADDDLL